MTRDEKIAEAKRLSRDEGLNNREIGERLGVGKSAVWKWLNPEKTRAITRRSNAKRNTYKREWEKANRAMCPECGTPLRAGSRSPSKRPALCRDCEEKQRREVVHERAEKIEKWWARGESLEEIADHLGWSGQHIRTEIHRLRGKGYSLPYRRRDKKVAHPEQVSA